MARPRISIITPSLNQAVFLERTIESVLGQEGDFELEYVVMDGGSTDGSADVLRRFEGRLTYRIEPDAGQADGINKGLRAATGDILGWVNSDDLLFPGALARVVSAFALRPQAHWLHGGCEIVDEQDRTIRRWITAYKDFRCRRYTRRGLFLENFVSQMTVFWRRSAMERVGLLDDGLKYTFDYEYWLRLSALGDPLYVPERLAAFRWYTSSKSGAHFERQFAEDHEVFSRHAPRDPLLRLRKRLRTAQIVAAYRLLRALRS